MRLGAPRIGLACIGVLAVALTPAEVSRRLTQRASSESGDATARLVDYPGLTLGYVSDRLSLIGVSGPHYRVQGTHIHPGSSMAAVHASLGSRITCSLPAGETHFETCATHAKSGISTTFTGSDSGLATISITRDQSHR